MAGLADALKVQKEEDQEDIQEIAAIPWYLIDPSGDAIRAQRKALAHKEQVEKLNNMSAEERAELKAQRLESLRKEKARKDVIDHFQMMQIEKKLKSEDAERKARRERYLARLEKKAVAPSVFALSAATWLRMPTLFPAWDAITAVALIFTALFTPFEVGYLPAPETALEPLFLVNRTIDVIFIIDMCFQFFLMHRIETPNSSDADAEWELDIRKIGQRYLKGWFLIDVASIVPSLFDILPLVGAMDSVGGVKSLRVIRALRLIKLVRLARTSRVAGRLVERVSWPVFYLTLMSLATKLLLLVHFYACITAISTTLVESPLDTWLATHGYCEPDGFEDPPHNTTRAYMCVEPAYLYFQTLKWSLGLIAANGINMFPPEGPYPPHYSDANVYNTLLTVQEDIMVHVLKFMGILIWSMVFGTLIRAIAQRDPDEIAYERDLDNLNRLCKHHHMPGAMARELRRYVHQTKELHRARSRAEIYSKLSPVLVHKATAFISAALLKSPLFYAARHRAMKMSDEIEAEKFVVSMVTKMELAVYAPQDRPPRGRLYVITKGAARFLGEAIGPGAYWGEWDVVMAHPKKLNAYATTYLHVQWINRADFQSLVEDFPELFHAMRRWVIKNAVAYYFISNYRKKKADLIKAQTAKLEGASVTGAPTAAGAAASTTLNGAAPSGALPADSATASAANSSREVDDTSRKMAAALAALKAATEVVAIMQAEQLRLSKAKAAQRARANPPAMADLWAINELAA